MVRSTTFEFLLSFFQQMEQLTETLAAPAATSGSLETKQERLMSLDVLRGFDMFSIVGADALVKAAEVRRQLVDRRHCEAIGAC